MTAARPDRLRRSTWREAYKDLHRTVTDILDRYDIMGIIDAQYNPSEYDLEAGTILPRLRSASGTEDVRRIVQEEFARWFGDDVATDSKRDAAADEIWEEWLKSPLRSLGMN